ncbi:MAG TPA: M28 family peptidase [Salinivirgaceae bacterium]|nr:M28 family peptidase [Salinivirgaceae bacterium]
MKVLIFCLLFPLFLWNQNLYSQEKEVLKSIVYTLASDSMQGRKAGTEGQKKAAQYIVEFYRKNNIPNIYGTLDSMGYLQKFSIENFNTSTRMLAVKGGDTVIFFESQVLTQNREKIVVDDDVKIYQATNIATLRKITDTLSLEGSAVAIIISPKHYRSITRKVFNRTFLLPVDSLSGGGNMHEAGEYAFLLKFLTRFSHDSHRTLFLFNHKEIDSRKLFDREEGRITVKSGVRFLIARGAGYHNLQTENVVSAIFSNNPDAPWIVLGAHYDHLGLGGINSGSLAFSSQKIHPGADDNASGTAAVMNIAQYFSRQGNQTQNNLLFVAFTAEELGLLGSEYFVNSPMLPSKTKGMINFDMIGRPESAKYQRNYVYAKKIPRHKPTFQPMKKISVDSLVVTTKVPLIESVLFRWGSDHVSFRHKSTPCLVLFTGTHEDYHKPTDTPEKLQYDNMERIVRWVIHLLENL